MTMIQSIQNRIFEVRGQRVMLDFDLAQLYKVETKVLNQAVKRNIKRFPGDFMFRLGLAEWQDLRSQIVTASDATSSSRSHIITMSQNRRNTHVTPYAFTEQGIAMLSGVLSSDIAINMNIAIMRAFVEIRKLVVKEPGVKEQLLEIRDRIGQHDVQLSQIYEAIENLLDEKASQKRWDERQRIGFKKE